MSKKAVLDNLDFRAFYKNCNPSLSGDPQASGKCPLHEDKKASFSVNLNSGLFNCHGCGMKGDVFTFYQELKGVDFKTALKELAGIAGILEGGGKQEKAVYDYTDENWALLYQVVRYEPKDFRPRRKGPNGGWLYDLQGVRRVPYNLPELVNASEVVIVEGEKDANNLKALGYAGSTAVTTSQGGAKGWKPEYAEYFLSKQVAIFPDNDRAGLEYAERAAQSLQGKASVIRIVELPGLGERKEKHGKDVSDWIDLRRKKGQTDQEIKGELARLVKEAPAWKPDADIVEIQQNDPCGFVMLDTVTPEPISWLWKGYIPLGKLSIIDGDPGLGKSTVTLDLVARVSLGASMPDGSPGVSGGAVLLTLEDGLADTIVPRLKATGADLSKIAALQAVRDKDGKPRLPTVEDIEDIKKTCHEVKAMIVVIDPLMAHLDGRTNSFRDQDMRRALTPLAKMAEDIGVAVIIVRHLNKYSGGQAIYRGGGSIGIIGAARCAYLVAKDPEDEERRIFAGSKNNLAPIPPSLSFSLEGMDGASRIVWGGVSNYGADALLAIPAGTEGQSAVEDGKAFLKDILSIGPVVSKEVLKQARAAGISEITLRRAKNMLGVKVQKRSFAGGWEWALNEALIDLEPFLKDSCGTEDDQESAKMLSKNDDHLRGELSTFEGKEAPNAPDKTPWVVEM